MTEDTKIILEVIQGLSGEIVSMREDINLMKKDIVSIKGDVESLKGDVELLKSDVKSLKSDVKLLKSDVKSLKNDSELLKDDVKSLKGDVKTLQSDVAELKVEMKEVKEITSKNALIVEKEIRPSLQAILGQQKNTVERIGRAEKRLDEQDVKYQSLEMMVYSHDASIEMLKKAN
jgi:chromosome segregation ATPase